MKTKLVRPVLVESKEPTELILSAADKYKYLHKTEYYGSAMESTLGKDVYQQLILISLEDEKIEVGDKYLLPNGIITSAATDYKRPDDYKKIIATQSQLSPEHIHQFIKEYNKGEVKDIRIEMEEYTDGNGMYRNSKMFQPKLTNGFITIVEKLQIPKISADDLPLTNGNYTEEEVIELLEKAFIKAASYAGFVSYYGLMPKKYAKEWFEQNKKKQSWKQEA